MTSTFQSPQALFFSESSYLIFVQVSKPRFGSSFEKENIFDFEYIKTDLYFIVFGQL